MSEENVSLQILSEAQAELEQRFAVTLIEALVSTSKQMTALSKVENVAIYVDYDNVYWTLTKYHQHNPDHDDPSKNLFERLWETYGRDHVRSFRAYADFQQLDRSNLTSLQKKRVQIRHVYSNGKGADGRKNSSDIELCIDAIESTFKDETISCYVFVTADSDMIPILSRMMYKGKRVELYYLEDAAPKHVDLASFAHKAVDLCDFLNIEKKRYEIADFVIDALNYIHKWQLTYKDNNRKWLGKPVLKDDLVKTIGIPEEAISRLIELLSTEELIEEKAKETEKGPKRSVRLTEKGVEFLTVEAAGTKEKE